MAKVFLGLRRHLRVTQTTECLKWVMQNEHVNKMEHGAEHNQDVLLLSVVQFQSLPMVQFKVTVMN